MKISFLKCKQDIDTYRIARGFGMDVFEIDNPELIDKKIEELKKQEYTTIFIPSSLASFSENMIKRISKRSIFKNYNNTK